MRRPRFKMNGRLGNMRWRGPNGEPRNRTDRLGHMVYLAAEQVVAGTGIDFECRTVVDRGRTKWHPLRMTFDEAVEYMEADWQLRDQLARCLAMRRRREEGGKPTYSREEYDSVG